ncbi:serine hydrolase [Flavobacterium sp. GN10]|uniref:Serine hydrolase n=1 Tax=Flavobacterium tagetis TaxID=2801336 RepID=A0ABS1K7C7_9FLAO|nr:serine hydrolase [Flavobacterium tagetis]MBL0735371.1 serine hydrolase [Flavobacterium tagetis]
MKLTITIGLLLIGYLTFGQGRIQKIDSLLNSLYSQEKINGNFLIAEKGKVIYSHSFGLANETTKEKLNENSIFELASCSKQFTAMGIMILKEKGKLNLDDDINKYLPELSFYKGITVRNLLNHTGGLPDYMQLMDSLFDKSKIATNKDIINIFSTHHPKILFEPNTKWEYSNTGYALLASIIEKASGLTYADYLKTVIFQPLKMKNTFVYNRRLSPKKIDNYAFGYVYSDSLKKYVLPDELEETKIVVWLDGIVGDGGVNSTVNDLLIWDRALYNNKLLTKEGMKSVFELATLKDGAKRNYGFGWGIEENVDFGKIANHDGGWPGYVTFIDRHLTNDKTIIILQNHNNVSIPSKAIRNILYNKPLPVQKFRKEISVTTEELQKFVGTYEVEKDFEIKISLDKDQLFSQLTGQNTFRIFAESEKLFFYKVVDAQIQFEKNEKGEISNLFLLQNGKKIEAKRTK